MVYKLLNKHIIIRFLSFFYVLVLSLNASAQISSGGLPYSFNNNLKNDVSFQNINGYKLSDLQRLDSIENIAKLKPYRFARELAVDLSPTNSGSWEVLPGGDKLWRVGIRSKGALSLYIVFDNFKLPVGAKLYLYNPDKSLMFSKKVFSLFIIKMHPKAAKFINI